MRKLVTLETVVEVRPIPDADAIEAIVVRGWVVVAKRGEFRVGDRCVYFEIDSALPLSDERFAFLGARGTNTTVTGTKMHVLKTARLRGVYSQGLALPTALFPELANTLEHDTEIHESDSSDSEQGTDTWRREVGTAVAREHGWRCDWRLPDEPCSQDRC
jgi:RNA ligase (TIGR02306 family)